MHILHICSDFSNQRIYNELITHISNLKIEQTVYVATRTNREVGKSKNNELPTIHYRYSHILKPFHRVFFHLKINTLFKDLVKNIDVSRINKCHAHFLFSDGAVALKLYKKKGIPYIVAVRNTDVNIFYKYMFHLRSAGLEILNNAEQVIFITPSYRSLLLENYIPAKFRNIISLKMKVIPNGIESYLLNDDVPKKNRGDSSVLKLLYVGDFSKNKNIPTLLKCVQTLNQRNINTSLTLVGGGGNNEADIFKNLELPDYQMVKFLGRINNREELMRVYRDHDVFIMISFRETFGVVYLEAMSQGLPVIYTKGQGIDGYFEEGAVGYSVNPTDIPEIISKIMEIRLDLERMSSNAVDQARKFNWQDISNTYKKLYE